MSQAPKKVSLTLIQITQKMKQKAAMTKVFTRQELRVLADLPAHQRRRIGMVLTVWEGTGVIQRTTKGYMPIYTWIFDL